MSSASVDVSPVTIQWARIPGTTCEGVQCFHRGCSRWAATVNTNPRVQTRSEVTVSKKWIERDMHDHESSRYCSHHQSNHTAGGETAESSR